MRLIYFLILAFALVFGAGCTGSKSYYKKGKKLQEAGLNDEAAQFYLISLQRNPKNVDAKIGLKVTGQKQIENVLNQFYKAYSVTNYKEAVYKYNEALSLQKRYGNFVTMEVPPYYKDYYEEMLVVYLAQQYEKAGDLLYEERFQEANVIYKEIVHLDPEYKDAKELGVTTTVEPLYRAGVAAFENQKYRRCYDLMSNVLMQKRMYKDAIDYKERALEEGQITIAVLQFGSNASGRIALAKSIQSDVVSGLTQLNDPFLKVLDRANMNDLITEQKINVQNTTTGNSAIKTGELLGANMLVKGKVLTYSATGGKIRRTARQGYESYKVKKTNPETKKTYYETRYKRVTYYEYEGSSRVFIEVQYQMISAETGEVVQSQVVKKESTDYVNYVNYSGNYKNLYAGKYNGKGSGFQKGDVIYSSYSQKNRLRRKVTTKKKTLESEERLAARAISAISKNIINGIGSYNPDEE